MMRSGAMRPVSASRPPMPTTWAKMARHMPLRPCMPASFTTPAQCRSFSSKTYLATRAGRSVDVPREDLLVIDIEEVKAAVTKVEKDIVKVEHSIEEVEEQIKTASEKALEALQGGNTPLFDYWRKKEEDLRKKEEDLRKEKEDLRKEEEDLRKKEEDLRARLAAREKLVERTAHRVPKPIAEVEWSVKVEPRIDAPALRGREQALDEFKRYLEDVRKGPHRGTAVWDLQKEGVNARSALLSMPGVKGTGKTRLANEIVTRDWGRDVKCVSVSYSGGGKEAPVPPPGKEGVFFARKLLTHRGFPAEHEASITSLEQGLSELRRKLGMESTDVLVVAVDELVELGSREGGERAVKGTMRALMAHQDVSILWKQEPTVFFFTSLVESYFEVLQTDSGRRVLTTLKLHQLQLSDAHLVLQEASPGLFALMKENRGVEQLVLQCMGHPRSLADGSVEAYEKLRPRQGVLELQDARTVIINCAKLRQVVDIKRYVEQWFSPLHTFGDDELEALRSKGLVHYGPDGQDYFFPLLLHSWASAHKDRYALAWHLYNLYCCDAELEATHEKKMEDVMAHFDAVRRCAIGNGAEVSVQEYFKDGAIDVGLKDELLRLHLPRGKNHVECLDFENTRLVTSQLREGYIVVAKSRTQLGFEYLIPFKKPGTEEFLVAAVQCKYVEDRAGTSWEEMKKKIAEAVRPLEGVDPSLKFFPVFYTTVDQQGVSDRTTEGAVVFTESTLFEFTRTVGILRLHLLKLGRVAAEKFRLYRAA